MNPDLRKEIDDNVKILVLVRGMLESGNPHWAYAAIPLSRYELFKQAEARGNYDLGDFGRIITHGSGKEPDEATIQRLKEEYGADHQFEEELGRMMQQVDAALKA